LNLRLSIRFLAIISLLFSANSYSAIAKKKKVKYRTSFGSCPSRTAGTLTLNLIKVFERTHSLRDVKVKIVKEKLKDKYFISDYKINYDPLRDQLNFKFGCPEPLMKVQIFKKGGLESYEAILVETGELFDPTYEVLLRAENKLSKPLPFLALPVEEMDQKMQKDVANLVMKMHYKVRRRLSEVILDENKELTMILSSKNRASSVFLGKEDWNGKLKKLEKIVSYMGKKRKVPTIINLTNAKKVVVKFND
jgi:hypothetical protein